MAKSIVQVLTQQELFDLFRKEAKIENDGKVEFTQRGVARLTGKHIKTIQQLLEKVVDGKIAENTLSKPLKPFAGKALNADGKIPDLLVSAIIAHYDKKGCERCEDLRLLFDAIGIRTTVQNAQHWQSDRSATQQLAWKYILEEPRKWSAQFPDSYYNELARLTNIHPKGSQRPHYWANLTNEFVYGYLPKEVEDGVRQAKLVNATNDRLHQFLKPDGLEMLQNHLNALTILMSSVSAIDDLRKLVQGRFTGSYQLALKLKID